MNINQFKIFLILFRERKNASSFLGHGSPMNAIEENQFVRGFRRFQKIPTPNAILCISAHWFTKGTFVTSGEIQKTIHDFYGFPPELLQWNILQKEILNWQKKRRNFSPTSVIETESWGLDHGAWSVIRHLYPEAQIPVIQMSIDYNATCAISF